MEHPIPERGRPLGEWRFDPELHRLRSADREVRLEPRISRLLEALLERAGRVATKDELLEEVWEERFLADSALSRAVAELRRALGDDARDPRYIETIPKSGYRLLPSALGQNGGRPDLVPEAAVTTAPDHPPEDPDLPPPRRRLARLAGVVVLAAGLAALLALARRPGPPPEPPLVAVLPLNDLSPGSGEGYFGVGMTEALVTRLAERTELGVVSGHTVTRLLEDRERLPERARDLGIDALVEGTVQREGSRVRISVRLVETRSEAYRWARAYEREVVGVLGLQAEVAHEIAAEIGATLGVPAAAAATRPTRAVDPAAWDLVLRASSLLAEGTPHGSAPALELFERAGRVDPDLAEAWAGAAQVLVRDALHGRALDAEQWRRAEEAAERALTLDPTLASPHASLGAIRLLRDWDLDGAEAAFSRALLANPSDSLVRRNYSAYLTFRGRFDEAVHQARTAAELDPLGKAAADAVAHALLHAGRFDELHRFVESVDPRFRTEGGVQLYGLWALALEGRHDEAIRGLRAMSRTAEKRKPVLEASLAWTLARAGRHEEARGMREEMGRLDDDPFLFACVDAALGDEDRAFAELERAFEVRSPRLPYLAVEPFLVPLRDEPRFRAMVERLGV